jgi:hypothetical protein
MLYSLNPKKMKNKLTGLFGILTIAVILFATSCTTPVTLTSWKNPKEAQVVSKIAVWGMFDKLEYQKTFEQSVVGYFKSKGLDAVQALSILQPGIKYQLPELEKKFDSINADGILIVTYKGTDKTETYVPQTTTVYPDYYYSYYGYYSWGYPMYGPGATVVTSGGYWNVTHIINLQANLYGNSNNDLLWTGTITVTDPEYIDQASYAVGAAMYEDLMKNGLLKKTK